MTIPNGGFPWSAWHRVDLVVLPLRDAHPTAMYVRTRIDPETRLILQFEVTFENGPPQERH
jgi:hypothetical protein